MVDGILYTYISSGHQGSTRPNITHGFNRTYGPQYHHSAFQELFTIAKYVPNYVPSSQRTTFKARIKLPSHAKRPIAILSENRRCFQDNVERMNALQYWAEIDPATGLVEILRVKEDIYRLTVYADGVFGMFVEDDVEISRRNHKGQGQLLKFWPCGTSQPSSLTALHTKSAKANPSEDWNYIHWSVFSHVGNVFRNETVYGINNWANLFDLDDHQLPHGTGNLREKTATLTFAFAGAKTGSRTLDWVNLPYTLNVNGDDVETWIISWSVSTSCGVRSAASCFNFEHKFTFTAKMLRLGENSFVLTLRRDVDSVEEAALPWTRYVQYDALRLEVG